MLTKKEFKKSKIGVRYNELKKYGEHIGVRRQGKHIIHLYAYNHFYVELWLIISLNQVHWIEVQENDGVIKSYAEDVDIKKNLGLN